MAWKFRCGRGWAYRGAARSKRFIDGKTEFCGRDKTAGQVGVADAHVSDERSIGVASNQQTVDLLLQIFFADALGGFTALLSPLDPDSLSGGVGRERRRGHRRVERQGRLLPPGFGWKHVANLCLVRVFAHGHDDAIGAANAGVEVWG